MNNPYAQLFKQMGESTQVPENIFIAKISNPLPDLKITLGDIELTKEDFLIDKYLIDRHLEYYYSTNIMEFEDTLDTPDIDLDNNGEYNRFYSGKGQTEIADLHIHEVVFNQKGNFHKHLTVNEDHDKLEIGDRVVVLNTNDYYIIISKVIAL